MKQRTEEILGHEIYVGMADRDLIVEGHAVESFEFDIEEVGDMFRVIATSNDPAVSVLEYGANPSSTGMVDWQEILIWIRKRGIQPEYGSQKSMAFAVARAIGKEGQPLNGGLKRPMNAIQKKAKRAIEREWEQEVDKLIRSLNA
jgi:hypothetical protein